MTETLPAPAASDRADPPAADRGPSAAGAIVASLRAHGTDRVFCVAGESYLAILDEFYDTSDVHVVTCRHEGSAALAALTDGKLTGRPGVCLVSRGPGVANAAIAVHAAAQDAAPLLLIVGQVPTTDLGRGAFQELDCERAFGEIAKLVLTLHDPTRAAEFVGRALRAAQSGTPGPALLVVPEDVLERPAKPGDVSASWPEAGPGPGDVRDAADMLRLARRPLVIAGGRLGSAVGRRALAEAARRHELPVLTSNKNQDLFDNRDVHYAGHLHNNTQQSQRAAFDDADLVLAVGTRLDDTTTGRQRFPRGPVPRQPLIQVYPDGQCLGLSCRPALGVCADPAAFLDHLAGGEPGPLPAQRRAWVERLHDLEVRKAQWEPREAEDGIAFGAVIAVLDELTDGDTVVTVDSGTYTSWVYRYLRLSGAGRLIGVSSSPMGFGLPAGIAAALRLRRHVVVVVGDGGLLMSAGELITAVGLDLPVIVIVADNGSYGTIRMHQEKRYPGRTIATDLINPDFVQMARSFGMLGLRVSDVDDIEPCLTRAFAHQGPTLIAVRTSLSWITAYRRLIPREARR